MVGSLLPTRGFLFGRSPEGLNVDDGFDSLEHCNQLTQLVPAIFEHSDMLQRVGRDAWANHLFETSEALINLVDLTHELIRRQQGRPELAEEALMEMDVPEE